MEWRQRQVTSGRGNPGPAGVVLSIRHVSEDHAVLKRNLDPEDRQVQVAGCCEEAFGRLSFCRVPAIITNDVWPDGDRMRIVRHGQAQPLPATRDSLLRPPAKANFATSAA